jgi:hypothetical protein
MKLLRPSSFSLALLCLALTQRALAVGGVNGATGILQLNYQLGSLYDFPDPKLSRAGRIRAMVPQPDGKMIIGGDFSAVNDIARRNIARLNVNGSVDATWAPETDGPVTQLALSGTDVFVAGAFTTVGGASRPRLAKVSITGNGAADAAWSPMPDCAVTAMAVSASHVFVAGCFTNIGGLHRRSLAKLTLSEGGAADATWMPALDPRCPRECIGGGLARLFMVGGAFTTRSTDSTGQGWPSQHRRSRSSRFAMESGPCGSDPTAACGWRSRAGPTSWAVAFRPSEARAEAISPD